MTLFFIILSTVLVSLVSFVGAVTLSLNENTLRKILFYLIALSIGASMGAAFFDLIPEAVEKSEKALVYILVGFFCFLLIEKFLHWRHCHKEHCQEHSFAYMNLYGDGLHNFLDGIILASSFMANIGLGIAATIAIVLHEIPQEISDFGVLIYGGFKKSKALFFNFISALTAVAGGIIGFYLLGVAESLSPFLIAFAAGGFIYIAASDLLPEVRKENNVKKTIINFAVILLGIILMYLVGLLEV